jgi:hypothetical protein
MNGPNAKKELTLTKPSEIPSALTLETYFRKKDVAGYSAKNEATYVLKQYANDSRYQRVSA